jgi:hypothetical protein
VVSSEGTKGDSHQAQLVQLLAFYSTHLPNHWREKPTSNLITTHGEIFHS